MMLGCVDLHIEVHDVGHGSYVVEYCTSCDPVCGIGTSWPGVCRMDLCDDHANAVATANAWRGGNE